MKITQRPKHCKNCTLESSYHGRIFVGDKSITRWWCCHYSKFADIAVGECKLKNGKKVNKK
jgi:hypothetical protein